MAWARLRDGEEAVKLLQLMSPVESSRNPEEVARYHGEPYAVAADVSSAFGRIGRSGWTWYTGSAGWMYRVWLEEVLGFKLHGNRLSIEPAIPEAWPGFVLTFRYGRTEYRIEVENNGEFSEQEILLEDDSGSHTIHISTGPRPSHKMPHTSSTPSVVA